MRIVGNKNRPEIELDPGWFSPGTDGTTENVRVADELLVDFLFAANGETYESVQQ